MSGKAFVDSRVTDAGLKILACRGKKPADAWTDIVCKKGKSMKIGDGMNYGIACGAVNGLYVVDCDKLKPDCNQNAFISGVKVMEMICDTFGDGISFHVPKVKTPSGGQHYYFKYESNRFHKQGTDMVYVKIRNGADQPFIEKRAKIDARSDHGYVVGPGSIHPVVGGRYEWAPDHILGDHYEIGEMPAYIEKLISGSHTLVVDGDKISLEVREIRRPVKTMDLIDDDYDCDLSPELLRDIVMGLSKTRAEVYDEWMKVLFAINTCSRKFAEKGLDIADEFSKQSSKYQDRDDVEKMMVQTTGSIRAGSLWYFLKNDNPKLFNELYKDHRVKMAELFYFRDYRRLASKAAEGELKSCEVVEFLKAVVIKIDNGGMPVWLTKNLRSRDKAKTGQIEFDIVHMPFQNKEDIKFTEIMMRKNKKTSEEEEVEVELSFGKLLEQRSKLLDFPCYDRLDNIPYLRRSDVHYDDSEVFNIFRGYAVKFDPKFQVDMRVIEPMLFHMHHVVCNNDPEIIDYLPKWIAHMIQKPWERPDVAIIMTSVEGTGKSKFWEFIGRIIGEKIFRNFNNATQITKKFNKLVEGALLVMGCEAKDQCEKFDMETFKSMITEETVTIEPKGVDPYTINTFARYVIVSNNSCPLKISRRDRRMFIPAIDDDKLQNTEYYNRLAELVKDPAVILNMFHYFAQMDISKFQVRKFPETATRLLMKMHSLPQPHRFIKSTVEEEFTFRHDAVKSNRKGEKFITTKVLFEEFDRWRLDNREGSATTKQNFRLRLEELRISVEPKKRKVDGNMTECYPVNLEEWRNKLGDLAKKQSPSPEAESDDELE